MNVLFFEGRKFSHLKCVFFFPQFSCDLLSLFYMDLRLSFIFLQPNKTIEIVLPVKFQSIIRFIMQVTVNLVNLGLQG